ncbi:hypothetical protein EH183_09890 [Streptomyces sp. CB01881]|nr:hypothetical protein C2142_09880 [Streptomyces sp. CB01881]TYC77689.1 hypothetical protein EH183_09890 [Streptomyces sp. CB01881]
MGTRSAGLGTAVVAKLSTGALHWIRLHSGFLDSPSGRAELPLTPRVKALLQLALLRRSWERVAPRDPGLAEVTGTLGRVWRDPGFPLLLAAEPRYAWQFRLAYGALAPAGITDGPHPAVLADVAAGGLLTPRRQSPFGSLETRYYADLAGVRHSLRPYRELYEAGRLARHGDDRPLDELDVCDVTHTVFHLTDFGFRAPDPDDPRTVALTGAALEHARDRVCRLTEATVRRGEWDLTGKLVLAQHCLGLDPLRTQSGAAGLRMLAAVQSPGGAIPGRSADDRADTAATTVEFFRKAYQSTVVTALATLTVLHGRPDGADDAEERSPAVRGAR